MGVDSRGVNINNSISGININLVRIKSEISDGDRLAL